MISRLRSVTATICILAVLAGVALPSLAAAEGGADMTSTYVISSESAASDISSWPAFDVLFLRPLGFGALALGAGLFVLSVPLVLITRPTEIGKPLDTFIMKPARYLWVDPLGTH
jgi:hypothetical protein